MTSSQNAPDQGSSDRAGLVRQVLAECIRRRSSGEMLPDESIIASHTELLPELEVELRKLRLVEHAHRVAGQPVPSADPTLPEAGAGAGPAEFPGYELLREIHRGGQGVVYQAIQKSTRQKVAIKVLHGGPFADAAGRARLAREARILGQLNHPHIVRVHDSGTAAGCPYYVMDYISGDALDAFLTQNPLPVPDLLDLMGKICDAVNAAHLCGVIHRDLKPSNIRIDPAGEPHVLDFGLAKVAVEAVTDESHPQPMSATGQFIGSLPWAAPEQAEGAPGKIDMRTDVYALGVILYRVLTGQMPYEVGGTIRDVLDRIMRAEPARPSTVCKALAPGGGRIDDELDTIMLKCLAKERNRRYQSAGELARDLHHYLAGEPIEAKRDSVGYVLRKQLRRYRLPVAIAAAFVVIVTVGFVTSLTFWAQAVQQRQSAEDHAQQAQLVADFLNEILFTVDPDAAQSDPASPLAQSLRRTIDEAAERVPDLAGEPEVEASVRTTLGRLYTTLGRYADGETHLRRAAALRRRVGKPQSAATAETLFLLGWSLKEQGKYGEARQAYDQSLAIRETLFGGESVPVAEVLKGIGQLLFDQRNYAQAQPYLERALDLYQRDGKDTEEIANGLANLGSVLRERGELTAAEPLLRTALYMRRQLFGPEHHVTLVSLNKLALLLRLKGELAEARALLEEYVELSPRVLGPNHAHVAVGLNNLGLTWFDEGQYAQAEDCFQRAVELYRRTRGPTHPQVAEALVNLGAAQWKQGNAKAAAARCEQALDILPPGDPGRAPALVLAGHLRLDEGDVAGAVPLLREAYQVDVDHLGNAHPATRRVADTLADCLTKLGRSEEADALRAAGQPTTVQADAPSD